MEPSLFAIEREHWERKKKCGEALAWDLSTTWIFQLLAALGGHLGVLGCVPGGVAVQYSEGPAQSSSAAPNKRALAKYLAGRPSTTYGTPPGQGLYPTRPVAVRTVRYLGSKSGG